MTHDLETACKILKDAGVEHIVLSEYRELDASNGDTVLTVGDTTVQVPWGKVRIYNEDDHDREEHDNAALRQPYWDGDDLND